MLKTPDHKTLRSSFLRYLPSASDRALRDRAARALAWAIGLALCAWFVSLIRSGLQSWFDNDDLMNLHYYWMRSWPQLWKGNLAFWSNMYRPAGGVFYRAIYDLWGFDPLPYRISVLALLVVNFGLLAAVVRRLTGSRWSALVALLLIGINASFSSAYFETGTVFDILAYTFFWGTIAWYLRIRGAGRLPRWTEMVPMLCLCVAALDSKEIAVSLPVAAALYECIWHPPKSRRPAGLWHWIRNEGRFAALSGALVAVFVLGLRFGPDSLWGQPSYAPQYSAGAYLAASAHYLGQVAYELIQLTPGQMAGLYVGMLLAAILTRRRYLLWASLFLPVAILPLAFIPTRNAFAYLVPSVGWAVYFSGILQWLLEWLSGPRIWVRAAVQLLLLATLFFRIGHAHRHSIQAHGDSDHDAQRQYRAYCQQIHKLMGTPRQGARVLLLTDAPGRGEWEIYFLIRLSYGDHSLSVDRRADRLARHEPIDPRAYDYVLDWANGRFVRVNAIVDADVAGSPGAGGGDTQTR